MITTVLAIWASIVGSVSLLLHAARFLWDRPRLVLKVGLGFFPVIESDTFFVQPPPIGFKQGDKIVIIEAIKRGHGAITISSPAGFRFSDGTTRIFVSCDRQIPARLEQSDKVTWFAQRNWTVNAVSEDKKHDARLKWVVCGTTEGERHARISRAMRRRLEGA